MRKELYSNNKINRCRPGFGASCSFCCGSHNYTLSHDSIEEMFVERGIEQSRQNFKHPEETSSEKLVKDGLQCANVGISQTDPGIICCLTYHDDHKDSEFESFFKGTCKYFLCPAWKDLTDRQILFCAELMKDWYYYSMLINSNELVLDLCAEYESPDSVPEDVLEGLKAELTTNLAENDFF